MNNDAIETKKEKLCSTDIEQGILASLIIHFKKTEKYLEDINIDDFYFDQHQKIFKTIQDISMEGRMVDFILVREQARKHFEGSEISIDSLLHEIKQESSHISHIADHIADLKEYSRKRKLFDKAHNILENIEEKSFEEHSHNILMDVFEIQGGVAGVQDYILPEHILETMKIALKEKLQGMSWGTGYRQIDRWLNFGFAPGMLSIIAARPSIGKSAFKLNIALNQMTSGAKILHFTPEQGSKSELFRSLAIMKRLNISNVESLRQLMYQDEHTGELKPISNQNEKFQMIFDYMTYLQSQNMSFVGDKTISLPKIRNLTRQHKRQHGLDIIYIDLFDRIKEINEATSNKPAMVAKALNYLSRMSMDEQVHVCGLVQINRKIESRSDRRPILSDLKDAGAYEEYADLIFGLYREGYYSDEEKDESMEVIGMKQRDGATFREKMGWIKEYIKVVQEINEEEIEDEFRTWDNSKPNKEGDSPW